MCGATDDQNGMFAKQSKFYDTMIQQASTVFGESSSVFKDLYNTFSPIVAAGPNQHGYDPATRTALNTQATEGTAQTYAKASKALGEKEAAAGGGNISVPTGADNQLNEGLLASAADNESAQKLKVQQDDMSLGRDNYFRAAAGLAGAPSVFGAAEGFDNTATGGGKSAADTANEMAQADNSWVNAVIGGVSTVAGAAAKGEFGG